MRHFIIGTAGHVDHGKTMLIKALTGVDTDRLKEEKERGISIDLGFAFLNLPGGKIAGIVDVPGHERFLKNMLAGIGGIDMVLLIIAADEGVMPQTREHLDIIQLLQIKKGIVVLTKIDLVENDWLKLVQEEVNDFLKGTVLENAPVIAVSSLTGQGLGELLGEINKVAETVEEKSIFGPMRLPVDRAFSITGFGTVVTGTLVSGRIKVGDLVEILPGRLTSRVRFLQVHGEKVNTADAGQRVAVNITGIDVEQVNRGSVLAVPGNFNSSYYLDVKLQLLKSAIKALKNRARVRLYLGTAEVLGRVILLDRNELKPGEEAYAQLKLERETVAARGDRYVIRTYSPMHTIGGGVIIEPSPARHKRFRSDVITSLAVQEKGNPEELIEQFLVNHEDVYNTEEISLKTGLSVKEVLSALTKLVEEDKAKLLTDEGTSYFTSVSIYQTWSEEIAGLLLEFHQKYSLREGFPKEELRSRRFSGLSGKKFHLILQVMEKDGLIKGEKQLISLANFRPSPEPQDAKLLNQMESDFKQNKFNPPAWSEICRSLGLEESKAHEFLQYFLQQGRLVKVSEDLYFHEDNINEALRLIEKFLAEKGEITIGEARDLFNSSRKYILPLLEYFDRIRFTKRIGDKRIALKR